MTEYKVIDLPLIVVHSHDMCHQTALLGSTVHALLTRVGFLPSVGADMFSEIFHLGRSERTVWTGEGLFSSVDASVLL